MMPIAEDLKGKSRYALIRLVRGMERAIKAECLRCMGVENARGIKDCSGLDLLEQEKCPLWDFRPWRGNR